MNRDIVLILAWAAIVLGLFFGSGECSVRAAFPEPIPAAVLWNARSVLGEAQPNAHRTGEAYAIVGVHVYRADRPANEGRSLTRVTRIYSRALDGRRPWVLALGTARARALATPPNLRAWGPTVRAVAWFLGLSEAERRAVNPCPRAQHYGSREDGAPDCPSHRPPVEVCREIGARRGWVTHFWRCESRTVRTPRQPARGRA